MRNYSLGFGGTYNSGESAGLSRTDGFTFVKLGKWLESASISAMNRAAQSARVAANRFIREHYALSATEINLHMRIVTRASKGHPYVTMRITDGNINLYKFNAKQVGKPGRSKKGRGPRLSQGVKATVIKGKRQLFRSADKQRGAFITTMKSGHTGVFIRRGDDLHNSTGRVKGLGMGGVFQFNDYKKDSIVELFGVRLTQLIQTKSGKSRVIDVMMDVFDDVYEKRLMHELNRSLRG
jgi:hypothetical protein